MKVTDRSNTLYYRSPRREDGASMWSLVRDSGTLDLNSSYCYLVLAEWFSDTCKLAVNMNDQQVHEAVGLVTGFRQPAEQDTLFVWQIAVDKAYRGQGIAMRLLDELTANSEIRYLEATISPSNLSSRRLFEKWANKHKAPIVKSEGFGETCFPDQLHEHEQLYRIGPIER